MNTTLLLGSGVGMTCFLAGSLCAMSADRYPAPKLLDVILRDRGGLPLSLGTGSGHGWEGWWQRLKFRVLELRDGKAGARRRRGEKRRDFYPLIGSENTRRPSLKP